MSVCVSINNYPQYHLYTEIKFHFFHLYFIWKKSKTIMAMVVCGWFPPSVRSPKKKRNHKDTTNNNNSNVRWYKTIKSYQSALLWSPPHILLGRSGPPSLSRLTKEYSFPPYSIASQNRVHTGTDGFQRQSSTDINNYEIYINVRQHILNSMARRR